MERYQEEYNTEKYSVLVQNAIKHYDNFELSVSINIPKNNITLGIAARRMRYTTDW